jgi:hypothetical protein
MLEVGKIYEMNTLKGRGSMMHLFRATEKSQFVTVSLCGKVEDQGVTEHGFLATSETEVDCAECNRLK